MALSKRHSQWIRPRWWQAKRSRSDSRGGDCGGCVIGWGEEPAYEPAEDPAAQPTDEPTDQSAPPSAPTNDEPSTLQNPLVPLPPFQSISPEMPDSSSKVAPFFLDLKIGETRHNDHDGLLLFAQAPGNLPQTITPREPLLQQWLASLLPGALNIEQTKFLNWEDLRQLEKNQTERRELEQNVSWLDQLETAGKKGIKPARQTTPNEVKY